MKIFFSVAALVAVSGTVAHAGMSFQADVPIAEGVNHNGGAISSVASSFTPSTQQFTFTVNYSNQLAQGFWLAVSPGADPKGHAGELALMYFDARTLNAPVLTIYNYNGENGGSSYFDGSPASGTQTPGRIASTLNGFAATMTAANAGSGRVFSISFDASVVNSYVPQFPGPDGIEEWTGVEFGSKFGIWFHSFRNLSASYGSNGFLNNWGGTQGWVDVANIDTTKVPAPGAIALAGLGGLVATRRRRS